MISDPLVLVVTGSPHAGKTQFVEALQTLTQGLKHTVLWVQFETADSYQRGEYQYRPQQLSKRNYTHLVARLNTEATKPAGSWVDVLFAHLPEPLQTHWQTPSESATEIGCHDVVLFPKDLPHTHNASAWHYGWRRLIEKHYSLVIIDNLPHDKHWVLHPLRAETITSVWLAHSDEATHTLQEQWQHWQACGLPLQGGVLLNDIASNEASNTTTPTLQQLTSHAEQLQWLGRLPLLHTHPPRDELSQRLAEQAYLDSVQLALQRLPWEGAVLFHPTVLIRKND